MVPTGGQVPDIYPLVPPVAAYLPHLLPLDELLTLVNFDKTILMGNFLDSFRWDARLYGLPVACHPLGVEWSPQTFAAAGLPAPTTVEWTYSSFTSSAATVMAKAAQGLPVVLGGIDYRWPWIWGSFAADAGGAAFTDGTCTLTSPAVLSGLTGLVDTVHRFGWNASTKPGVRGPCAFSFTASPPASGNRLNPFPSAHAGTQPCVVYGYGISASCRFPEVAADFLTWLLKAKQQVLLSSIAGYGPVTATPQAWDAWKQQDALKNSGISEWLAPDLLQNAMGGWPSGQVTWPGHDPLVSQPGNGQYWDAVGGALGAAASTPTQLSNLMKRAQTLTNAALTTAHQPLVDPATIPNPAPGRHFALPFGFVPPPVSGTPPG